MNRSLNVDNDLIKKRLGRISHDLQSPIATIEICAFLLTETYTIKSIDSIRKALQKIRVLSKDLLEV